MIQTRLSRSKEVGSCNACDRQVGPKGTIDGDVIEVSLNSITFRLCRACSEELVSKIGIKPREISTGWGG